MKFILTVLCASSAFAFSVPKAAEVCSDECKRENNCACASVTSPIDTLSTPQFVTLTFDDSATALNNDEYYSKLLNRKNPDGTPVSATFYVPHQFTDYEVVNKLYNNGHDIGAHSVTKDAVEYWRNATKDQLKQEFSDNREITAKFANIPIDDILGVRTPHLELAGDTTFSAYTEVGLSYDSSFVTLSGNHVFPFTLDYNINNPCVVGTCPIESHPGFWILPIINLISPSGIDCNALFGCQLEGSAEEIKNWLVEQFNRMYIHNRAPVTFLINSVWFQVVPNSYQGLELFLDYLGTQTDVFLVSHAEVVAWSKQPVAVDSYKTNHKTKSQSCNAVTCFLRFEEENEERIMKSCVPCPSTYPWLGNPNGNLI